MKIGLFTDTFRPSINGITYVVESLKKHLEEQGHTVYVFCPAHSIRTSQQDEMLDEGNDIITFPSIKGGAFESYDNSIFFPPYVLSKIKDLELDVIHFFTPGQVGLMAVYAAHKIGVPVIAQHSTDLRQYVEHYKDGIMLPMLLLLISIIPLVVKMNGQDVKELLKLYWPRKGRVEWNIDIVERAMTLVYSKCDAVIALSRKSKAQLESWQKSENYIYDVTLMPSGVDALPAPSKEDVTNFKKKWNISNKDKVFGFVGRLGAEKNLDLLIPALEIIAERNPSAKLMFVGDFEHREALEKAASESDFPDNIIFTGAIPREELGVAYGAMDLFVFPSLTDTQGWVIHEAAHAGLPLVLIDKELSEVLKPGVNGGYANNSAESVANTISNLLFDDEKLKEYSVNSKEIAKRFTEKSQIEKLSAFYKRVIVMSDKNK